MWILFLTSTVIATETPTFEPIRNTEDCHYSVSAADADGYPILRAECRWPELSLEQIDAVLRPMAGHQDTWSAVASSTVLEQGDDGARVRQVHVAPLMDDRLLDLRMWVEPEPGGMSFRWTLADGQPEPPPGSLNVVRDDGCYTVLRDGDGVHVVATLQYDPGGTIPAFLVSWFQQLALPRFLEELKAAALSAGRVGLPPRDSVVSGENRVEPGGQGE